MGKAFNRYPEDTRLGVKGYSLSTFRKDFISRCQKAGIPISGASMSAGHSKIATIVRSFDFAIKACEVTIKATITKIPEIIYSRVTGHKSNGEKVKYRIKSSI